MWFSVLQSLKVKYQLICEEFVHLDDAIDAQEVQWTIFVTRE
jgi:hypothetical protein